MSPRQHGQIETSTLSPGQCSRTRHAHRAQAGRRPWGSQLRLASPMSSASLRIASADPSEFYQHRLAPVCQQTDYRAADLRANSHQTHRRDGPSTGGKPPCCPWSFAGCRHQTQWSVCCVTATDLAARGTSQPAAMTVGRHDVANNSSMAEPTPGFPASLSS